MGHIFTGTHRHKVDGKGRVSIPADFRSVLQACDPDWTEGLNPSVYVHHGPRSQRHLECFTVEAMDELNGKIRRLRRSSQVRKKAERLYNGMTMRTTVDETGRLVLPAAIREKIGVRDTAVFAARGDSFEIWSPETYDAELDAFEAELDGDEDETDILEQVELELERMEASRMDGGL